MSSSLCSAYRYEPRTSTSLFVQRKAPEFSWFSVALKNIKETSEPRAKIHETPSTQEIYTTPTVCDTSATPVTSASTVRENAQPTASPDTSTTPTAPLDPVPLTKPEQSENGLEPKVTRETTASSSAIPPQNSSGDSPVLTERKTLTALYLERKNRDQTGQSRELRENEQQNRVDTYDFHTIPEEGPVRQSLLSLVMDEDVPQLMEAMAEKLEFVFEDLTPTASSAAGKGILRRSKSKIQCTKETKLKFSAEPPTVFTYLDEETAAQEVSWDDGQQISFQIYQELCSREKIRSQQEKAEMERLLRSSVAPSSSSSTYLSVKTVSPLEQPSADESLLGVTGRITYSTAPVDITRFNKNSM